MDERLFGSLSDRVRLASDEVEMVMRAEVRELIARRIRDEVDLFPAAASVRADGSCSDVESVRTRLAYEGMLKAAVPETVQRFTGTTAPTGILSVAAGGDGRRPGSGEARETHGTGLPGAVVPFRTWPGASYGNRRPRRHRHQRSAPAPFGAGRGTSA